MRIFFQQKVFVSPFAILFILLTLLLSGCANNKAIEVDAESAGVEVTEVDPYEGFNRNMFVFNDTLDTYVADPISDAYAWITPQFVQIGVSNFFSNLNGINVFLNDFMQGKGAQGVEDTGRFLVNSTFGLLGLFDVATELGLEKHEEDFAQTLAVWGVPQGPYLVLPLLGPSTTRGIPGGVFDAATNPATYVGAPIQLLQILNARANADTEINFVKEAALDPYVFTRESFLQYRNNLIADGLLENDDDLLDLDDEFDEEDIELTDQPISEKQVDNEVDKAIESSALLLKKKSANAAIDPVDDVIKSLDNTEDLNLKLIK